MRDLSSPRPIKFRAAVWSPHFDDHAEQWLVSINSFTLGELWEREVELDFSDQSSLPFGDIDWETDQVQYLQFTGLKDRKGKEIYEGDIIQYRTESGKKHIVPVRWEQAGFYPKTKRSFTKLPLHASWVHKSGMEVIGNVHETPELLNPPSKAKPLNRSEK